MYRWPNLDPQEIVVCLGELEIPITIQQLRNPTPEKMREIYTVLIEFLMGVSPEELDQPDSKAMEVIEYAELHAAGIAELQFKRQFEKLMVACGVSNWSLERDLKKPTGNRVVNILSAIINFAKFREERLANYEQVTIQAEELALEKDKLTDENQRFQAELNRLQQQREAEEPKLKELQEKATAYEEQISELNLRQLSLQNETRVIKVEATKLGDMIKDSKYQINLSRQELMKMKSKVVESPERLQKLIADMKDTLVNEKDNVESAEQRARDIEARVETLRQVEKSVSKCVLLMEDVGTELEKSKHFDKQVKELKAKTKDSETQLRNTDLTSQHLVRQVDGAKEKLDRLRSRDQNKREVASRSLVDAKREKMNAEKENTSIRTKIKDHENQVGKIEESMKVMQKQHDAELEEVNQLYGALREQVNTYHSMLAEARVC